MSIEEAFCLDYKPSVTHNTKKRIYNTSRFIILNLLISKYLLTAHYLLGASSKKVRQRPCPCGVHTIEVIGKKQTSRQIKFHLTYDNRNGENKT
jgi:hypothetical protein